MKELIYKFFDKNYPINGNRVDVSFEMDVESLIEDVFNRFDGEDLFSGWLIDRGVPEIYSLWNERCEMWFKGDKMHRDNDLPAVIFANGQKQWWVDDKFIKGNNPLFRDNE